MSDFSLKVAVSPDTAEAVNFALKRLKRRMTKFGIYQDMQRTEYFVKPSLLKRQKRQRRIYAQKRNNNNQNRVS